MSDANEAAKLDREAYINGLSLNKVKAEQIPDTCEWHAISTFCVEGATWKDIIAAAINAWPGLVLMEPDSMYQKPWTRDAIILTLPEGGPLAGVKPQEAGDDQA